MHLQSLTLLNFKNYHEVKLDFLSRINCFAGNNGSGKTNLLDAIYYLSFCKGFCNPSDIQNILFDEEFFVIQGQYKVNGNKDELYCAVKKGQRKVFKRNKKEYDRLADHIGFYPLVLIYPGDVHLIQGGSDERRKFVDGVIAQYNKEYLHRLLDYNKALLQRNILLKTFAEKRYFDEASLEIWDEQLKINGIYIFEERKSFFERFKPVFQKNHDELTGKAESIDIDYESQLKESDPGELLLQSRNKDRILQHTTTGIHKDNLVFLLNGQAMKKFGSQGQQKSYVIALKLAQFQFTKQLKGFNPILLFDDIFDKLDPRRVELLVRMVSENDFGQVFITDTHTERLVEILEKLKVKSRIFDIVYGEIAAIKEFG
ncbi:MAG: DNA replication/repair protein RecF [Bacteroidetes bacterium]|nr:MAG: DNA replication/repair protein RecF [Bacteroidota bacterium]